MRRREIRQKYNLEESPCGDFLVHFFCHECAQCQENRELRRELMFELAGGQNNGEPLRPLQSDDTA